MFRQYRSASSRVGMLRHDEPGPRKTGIPEGALNPAPRRATIRLDALRCAENSSMELISGDLTWTA